jgi:hypothetical protein
MSQVNIYKVLSLQEQNRILNKRYQLKEVFPFQLKERQCIHQ